MSRLILAMQYPAHMRYQEWWYEQFPKNLLPYFDSVIILGSNYLMFRSRETSIKYTEHFSPIHQAIEFETEQIKDYMNLELRDNDVLLVADLSFPGFFCQALYHKKPKRTFAICHATSLNYLDYFEKDRESKFFIETGNSKLFNTVFCATEYHKKKLKWDNIQVIGLPWPLLFNIFIDSNKEFDLISVARITPQKVDMDVEKAIETYFNTKIERRHHTNWFDYYKFISKSKVMIITSSEETFGYQIVDAILNKCVPIAPNRYSYPELLSKEYLYNTTLEAQQKITSVLNGKLKAPKYLLNQNLVDNFYKYLATEMKY